MIALNTISRHEKRNERTSKKASQKCAQLQCPRPLARGEAAALDALTALLDAAQYHAGIAGLLRLVADAKRRNIERRKKLAEENLADFPVPINAAIARMMREAYYRRDWDAVREIEVLADKLGAVQSPDLQDVMAQMYRDQQDDAARS